MGITGVPVRCATEQDVPPQQSSILKCVAADGTPFDNGQDVPEGFYLLVTDIVILSRGLRVDLSLYDAFGPDDNQVYSLHFDGGNNRYFSEHFNTPYMILEAGHRLIAINHTGNILSRVYVSGLLVASVTYVPMFVNN